MGHWQAIGTVGTHLDPLTMTTEDQSLIRLSLEDMDSTWNGALEHRLTQA